MAHAILFIVRSIFTATQINKHVLSATLTEICIFPIRQEPHDPHEGRDHAMFGFVSPAQCVACSRLSLNVYGRYGSVL